MARRPSSSGASHAPSIRRSRAGERASAGPGGARMVRLNHRTSRPQSTNANSLLNSNTWANCVPRPNVAFSSAGAATNSVARPPPRRRVAAERQAVQGRDLRLGRLRVGRLRRAASAFACSLHERAVHQEQRLLRHRRRGTAAGLCVSGLAKSNDAEHARQVLPVDEAVDRPPRSVNGALNRSTGRPPTVGSSRPAATSSESRSASNVQPPAVHRCAAAGSPGRACSTSGAPSRTTAGRSRESMISRCSCLTTSRPRRSAPRASRAAPGASAGRVRTPKSLGVRTRPWPKWSTPDAVDHHAGRQRVVLRLAIACASSSRPLPSLERLAVRAGDDAEELPRHLRRRGCRVAAEEDDRLHRRRRVGQHHRPRRGDRGRRPSTRRRPCGASSSASARSATVGQPASSVAGRAECRAARRPLATGSASASCASPAGVRRAARRRPSHASLSESSASRLRERRRRRAGWTASRPSDDRRRARPGPCLRTSRVRDRGERHERREDGVWPSPAASR